MQPSKIPAGLPQPDADSLRHSERVADYLRTRLAAAGGAITFGEFMHDALYAPGLGYYVAGAAKFAAGGDFVTAPEISPLFGRVLARQIAACLAGIEAGGVLELGAGSGALAVQLLTRLAEAGAPPSEYRILEVSPELSARQRDRLAAQAPGLLDRVRWIDRLPTAFDGVLVANEVADALPVERFAVGEGGLCQAFVVTSGSGFALEWRPATPGVAAAVQALGLELPRGYVSEICPGLKPWVAGLADAVANGLVLLFDYGLSRREYYAPDRSGGWLRCHFRHRAHDEPLIYPGIQDITSWVDFTAIAEAAVDRGAEVAGFVTQAMFLLHGGLQNEAPSLASLSTAEQIAVSRQIKQLTLPSEMGENFKCIGLRKGDAVVPDALLQADRSAALLTPAGG